MAREYQMLIDGEWVPGKARREVKNKYDGSVLGTVPIADAEEVDQAIQAAQRAFPTMAEMTAYQRSEMLGKAVSLLKQRREEIARMIAASKPSPSRRRRPSAFMGRRCH